MKKETWDHWTSTPGRKVLFLTAMSFGMMSRRRMLEYGLPRFPWQQYDFERDLLVGPLEGLWWHRAWWHWVEGPWWRALTYLGWWDTDEGGFYRKGRWTFGHAPSARQQMYRDKYTFWEAVRGVYR